MEIIKNIDDKIKILFLKSNTHWGGPWFSFNFKDTTIDEILNNSFGKAGHPIPMICLYKMDVIIVDNNDLINVDIINYNIHTTQQCANNYKKYMKNIYKLKDVPFNKYNIIYTEDEIIPKNIIDNYKNILFIFNASEHYFNKKNYDEAKEFLFDERKIIGINLANINKEKLKDNHILTLISSWKTHYNSWKNFNKNHLLIKYEHLINEPDFEFGKLRSY